jgi:micrococcal nuclease
MKRISLFLVFLFIAGQAPAREFFVHVLKGLDGDSLLLSNHEQVRLLGIDAPEKGEPWAEQARSFTKMEVEGKDVLLETGPEERDHYHRILAYVYCDGHFLNQELLQWGLAHVYIKQKGERFAQQFIEVQRVAIQQKIGEWSEPDPTTGPVFSSGRSYVFHRDSCSWLGKVSKRHRVRWATRTDALLAGLSPCRSCKP